MQKMQESIDSIEPSDFEANPMPSDGIKKRSNNYVKKRVTVADLDAVHTPSFKDMMKANFMNNFGYALKDKINMGFMTKTSSRRTTNRSYTGSRESLAPPEQIPLEGRPEQGSA